MNETIHLFKKFERRLKALEDKVEALYYAPPSMMPYAKAEASFSAKALAQAQSSSSQQRQSSSSGSLEEEVEALATIQD